MERIDITSETKKQGSVIKADRAISHDEEKKITLAAFSL